ncbi:HlyD family secretion protein [Methylobacterium oryzisoli]|uniref:HlyD family secretion protein n=1 Tax=Methylobacterium oryzisoli TaxID=3385502 RepID=UPI0038929EFB
MADGEGRDPEEVDPQVAEQRTDTLERSQPGDGGLTPVRDGGREAETDRRSPAPRPEQGGERNEPASNASQEDADPRGKPSVLRRHPIWFGLGALAVVALGVAGYFYWLIYLHPYESTDDAFVDARQYTIAPKVSGYVVDVPVTDNQHVEPGDTLFTIEERDYHVALLLAQAQVKGAQAALQNISAQIEGQKAQVDVAKAQVENAQAALKFAQEDAARYKDLAERGAGTVQKSQSTTSSLQQQQASVNSANAGVVAAQNQVASLEAQKAGLEASLAQVQASRDQANLNLGYTKVKAAQAGRVVQLTGAKGQYASVGQSLSMFVPDEKWVVANYKETQITDMRPGQHVDIEIDAYPNRKITGRVDSVQPGSGTAFSLLPTQNATGNYVKVVQRIPVKIVVENWPSDVSIGPGMSIVPTVRVR